MEGRVPVLKETRIGLLALAALVIVSLPTLAVAGTEAASPKADLVRSTSTQVILEPTAMAWVSSAEPTTNFGGLGYVWAGYGQGSGPSCCSTLRGLVKFDLSGVPANATITDARLYATIWGAQGPADHFTYWAGRAMDQVTRWTEESVTWNNKPNAAYGLFGTDISATFGQVSWGVTDYVQDMVDGTWFNNGFYLMRENDNSDPQEHARMFGLVQLAVTYEVVPPTPTPTPEPMVEITKMDRVDPVYAGDVAFYTIRVRNVSNALLERAWLKDMVPEGTSFVEASGGGALREDGTVTWRIPPLGPGASHTVHLALRTLSTLGDGTVLTNLAEVGYILPNAQPIRIDRREATETTTVRRRMEPVGPTEVVCPADDAGDSFNTATDIPLGMSSTSALICPADDEDWFKFQAGEDQTIDVWLGDMAADFDMYLVSPQGVVEVTNVRAGLTDEHLTWYVRPGRAGEWRLRIFGHPGASAVGEYRVQVRVFDPTPTPTNTPTRTNTPTPTGTPVPTETPTPTTVPLPELTVDKWLEEDHLVAGELAHYTIRVTNRGPGPAYNVFVRDILPQRSTFEGAEPAATPDPDNPRRIPWPTIAELAAGESVFFEVIARINENVPKGETLRNEAIVNADGVGPLRDLSEDVVAAPRLSIVPRVVTAPVEAGEEIAIRACVRNEGAGQAQNVTVVAALSGSNLQDISPSAPGHYDRFGNEITWELGDIDATAGCVDVEIDATLQPTLRPGETFSIGWTARADNAADVSVDQTITVDYGCVQATLTWDLSDEAIGIGELTSLNVTVEHDHPQPIHDFWLTLDLSAHLQVASHPASCDVEGKTVACPLEEESNTQGWTIGIRMVGEQIGEQTVTMEVTGRELCVPVVETVTIEKIPDLRIDGTEVTQAIQRYKLNNVRLIEGRKTWIRVYPITDGSYVNNVPCKLSVYRCDGGGCDQFVGELPPVENSEYLAVGPSFDRGDGTQSFIFGLHQDWAWGTLQFVPEVNPEIGSHGDHWLIESDYTNNVGEPVQVEFHPSTTLDFAWIQAQYFDVDGDLLYATYVSDLDDDIQWMRGALPFRDVVNLGLAPPEALRANQFNFTSLDGWSNAVLRLDTVHDSCEGDPVCAEPWVYVIPQTIPGCCGGVGGIANAVGGNTVIVQDIGSADTLAHEFGHVFGLGHADCGLPADDSFLDRNLRVFIEDYGLDVETLAIYPPNSTYEMMTYCSPTWISIQNYNHIYQAGMAKEQATEASGQAGGEASQPGLLVTGSLTPDEGTGAMQFAELRLRPGGPFDHAGSGPYSLELRDAGASALFTRHVSPTRPVAFAVEGKPALIETLTFKEVLPPQPGMTEIILLHGGTILDTRAISANAPEVTLLVPNGGEVINAPFEARWQAEDADDDPLTFALQISRDGGQGWLPITQGMTETTYILDPNRLPGSDQARLRVIANDGVRTGIDISDDDFSVPNHAPQVRIVRPHDGARVRAGTMMFLGAAAWDREDRAIAGQLAWQSDKDGPLGTGRQIGVATLAVGRHTVTASVTDSGGLSGSDSITIIVTPPIPSPGQCSEVLVNGDFEEPGWGGWAHGGSPEPLITSGEGPGSTNILLLGNPDGPDVPRLSWVRQMVTLPEETVHARLSFRYRVASRDRNTDRDWFLAAVTRGEEEPLDVLRMHGGWSRWQTVTADLSEYAGQTIGLLFAVRNDGQAGGISAYVDDVSLCVSGAPPVELDLDGCWLSDGLPDYAPAGLPDFDQRQSLWRVPDTVQWSHDGPVTVADLLWWRDAAEEPEEIAPPDVSDGYPLVETYGVWDDHDPRNVPPLVADLGALMGTNDERPGTDLDNLVSGLNAYLSAKELDEEYTLTLRRSPSYDWIREEVKQNRQVLLLLGFWEQQPGGWRRLGGHYVGVAGAGCGDEDWVGLSDPFRNATEMGWPGRMVPADPHGHSPDSPHTVHNDAAFASHDVYGITRTGMGWGPQGYARSYGDVDNFAGLNFAPALEGSRAGRYLSGDILTLADYALVLAPRAESVTLNVSPALSRVRAGEGFRVEMEVQAGVQEVDRVQAFLDFDPAVLQVVDAEGDPATTVTPGDALPTVLMNDVDNVAGRVSLVVEGDAPQGRFLVAVVHLRAISTALSSQLSFDLAPPVPTDVRLAGESVLSRTGTGRVCVGPGALLTGQAEMQRQSAPPDPSWRVPLLLTLSRVGEPGPAYVFGTMSAQNGAFAMPGVAAPGQYQMRLKGLHTLRNLLPTTLSGGANVVNVETLLEGDAVNDNRVDVRDVSVLATAYGKSQGQDGFDRRADFNEDDIVDAADLALLQANLGRRGDVLVGVSGSRLTIQQTTAETLDLDFRASAPAGTVTLRLEANRSTAAIGDVVTLDVMADAGTQEVDAAELHLDYDPTVLQLVDAAGDPATSVEPGTALPTVLLNSVDPARGWADYVGTNLGSSPATGTFSVATLRFQVLQEGETWIRFGFSDWRATDVTYQAESVLEDVEAARIRATAAYSVYLPVVLKH